MFTYFSVAVASFPGAMREPEANKRQGVLMVEVTFVWFYVVT